MRRCAAITKHGMQCSKKTRHESTYCNVHINNLVNTQLTDHDEVFMPMPPTSVQNSAEIIDRVAITEITKKIALIALELKDMRQLREKISAHGKKLTNTAKRLYYHDHKAVVRSAIVTKASWKEIKAITDEQFANLPNEMQMLYINMAKDKLT